MTAPRAFTSLCVIAACAALLAACSEDSTAEPHSTTGAGGAGGGEAIGSVTVVVRRSTLPVFLGFLADLAVGYEPAAGATVALDAPGGARREQVTDAEGRTTFEGLDWSLGTAAVTAHLAGHSLASRVGIDGEQGEIGLRLVPFQVLTPTVEVSGTALNMASLDHYLLAGTTVPGKSVRQSASPGAEWSVPVLTDTPFTIVALEYSWAGGPGWIDFSTYGWAVMDQPPVTEPTTATLDFASTTTPTVVNGSFSLPDRADSPLRTDTFGMVQTTTRSSNGSLLVALATSTELSSDRRSCDYVAEYVELSHVEDPITLYEIQEGGGGDIRATVVVEGYPEEGPRPIDFVDLPDVTTPSHGQLLREPIEWVAYDSGVSTTVYLVDVSSDRERYVWGVTTEVDAVTLTVPAPPSTATAEELFGDGPILGKLYAYRLTGDTHEPEACTGPVRMWFDVP